MNTTIIHLHPELTIAEVAKLAEASGLRLAQDSNGNFILEPYPSARLPNGERYTPSELTDVRSTIARARAQRALLRDG